jgi:FixJ family two-component response regulator
MTSALVYVVDDDPSVLKGLTRLLRSAGYAVTPYDSATAFLAGEPHPGAACVVLDLRMPVVSGSDLQAQLEQMNSALPIIFLSGHAEVKDSVRAMKHGAFDFLTKPVDDEVLLSAIRKALDHHERLLAERRAIQILRQRIGTLTERELETARWVISGLLNKQIAAELGIAEKTVKIHRARVMEKMGATSVPELVRLFGQVDISPLGQRD